MQRFRLPLHQYTIPASWRVIAVIRTVKSAAKIMLLRETGKILDSWFPFRNWEQASVGLQWAASFSSQICLRKANEHSARPDISPWQFRWEISKKTLPRFCQAQKINTGKQEFFSRRFAVPLVFLVYKITTNLGGVKLLLLLVLRAPPAIHPVLVVPVPLWWKINYFPRRRRKIHILHRSVPYYKYWFSWRFTLLFYFI